VLVFARTLLKINAIQNKAQGMAAEASALWSIAALTRRAEREGERRGGAVPPRLAREVEIRDVDVAFDGRPVLERLSLSIPAGRITALIGPSGAGKTTISDLVSGLVTPDAGAVLVDGVDLAALDLQAWRRQIGFVPQETLLLHESVRANITLGDPELRDADVEAALRDAGAWDLVRTLPEGLDTSVGERGALLSGGQRQRIALARALVHRPRLLILDEATAALDAESEAAVWATLARLRGRTAILAISHQPGLAELADRVYRVEGGRARPADRAPREVA